MNDVKVFAEEVASRIEGAKITEVEKANGVRFTGITVKSSDSNISPTVYVDDMLKAGLSVDEAVEKVEKTMKIHRQESIDIDFLYDYEKVVPRLDVHMYNEATNAEVCVSAKKYGFEDLILVPVITVNVGDSLGTIRVTKNMLEKWGKTKNKVINDAIKNMNPEIFPIQNIIPVDDDAPNMFVVSNKSKVKGASCIIKTLSKLKEVFPEGFAVIPSSVHEVIAISKNTGDFSGLCEIICCVNATEVNPEEVLSNRPYIFE